MGNILCDCLNKTKDDKAQISIPLEKQRDHFMHTNEQIKQKTKPPSGNIRKATNQRQNPQSANFYQRNPNQRINQGASPTFIQPQPQPQPQSQVGSSPKLVPNSSVRFVQNQSTIPVNIRNQTINQGASSTFIQPQSQVGSSPKLVPNSSVRFVQNQSSNDISIRPTNSLQTDTRPKSSFSSRIIQNKSQILLQKQVEQLKQKQDIFRNSPQFIKAQNLQLSIQQLLQIASTSHEYKMHTDEKAFYKQALNKVQQIENNYSLQSISEIKSHVYSQLVYAVIAENKNERQADQYLSKAIEAYNQTIQSTTIEERITLLNNYSVFKRNRGNLLSSKSYLQQAIKLMNKYYVVNDQRKYLALINLACLEYQSQLSSSRRQAQIILDRVLKECKNEEIIRLAEDNRKYYK